MSFGVFFFYSSLHHSVLLSYICRWLRAYDTNKDTFYDFVWNMTCPRHVVYIPIFVCLLDIEQKDFHQFFITLSLSLSLASHTALV